ncbi:hypothetical protein CCZ28_06165 [Pseudomonas oryzihabitans]|nr:hypothetical protein CCZ28_06165 [Pseudomonas psychrotolerans]
MFFIVVSVERGLIIKIKFKKISGGYFVVECQLSIRREEKIIYFMKDYLRWGGPCLELFAHLVN